MSSQSVVLNPRPLGFFGFLRELRRARRVGPGPETVFRLLRPFHGPEFDRIYERCMADPTARRLLEEGRSLHPVLLDFAGMRAMPEASLGRAYVDFMEANQIDIVSFAEASFKNMKREDYANDAAWAMANRLRDIHEIVHVISGYGTDVLGEMCELVFNLAEDPRPKAVRFVVRMNLIKFERAGHAHARAAIAEAYQRGKTAGSRVGQDWADMLDWDLDTVRAQLGISPPTEYAPIDFEESPPTPSVMLRALLTKDADAA
ncbi:MAG: ubiquinone biosynthesis protein COQ4 [bacterium]|nr:ubiquinone biosynthesis protein COQ4 [bacterium]